MMRRDDTEDSISVRAGSAMVAYWQKVVGIATGQHR